MDAMSLGLLVEIAEQSNQNHFVFLSRPILGLLLLEKIPKIPNSVHLILKGMGKTQIHDMIVSNRQCMLLLRLKIERRSVDCFQINSL